MTKVANSKIDVMDERDWILKRPTIYLGPTSFNENEFYFPQFKEFKTTKYTPAVQKIFDEVLENSVDEYIRTKGKYADIISVDINPDNSITVKDNGRGLPIEFYLERHFIDPWSCCSCRLDTKVESRKHSDHIPTCEFIKKDIEFKERFKDKYTPEVIFTVLRSGSNFNDNEGGRQGMGVNGVGVSLVALFSNRFSVKTYQNNKSYYQEFNDMLMTISTPKVKDISSTDTGTEITFLPNFEFFKSNGWNVDMIQKRIIDLAYAHPKIKFKFNGETIQSRKIVEYLYADTTKDTFEMIEGNNVRFLLTSNTTGDFKCASFVNGANVFKGGHHVNYPVNEIINYIRPKLEKKFKIELSPKDIRNHISCFVWLNMANPLFSSQTKEEIINTPQEIKTYFDDCLDEKFFKKILANDIIVNKIVEEALAKKALADQVNINRAKKAISKRKVKKLLDANSSDRKKCTLFLCEGDSAMSNSEGVRDQQHHAFLALKGKVLGVYDANISKILANEEIKDIVASIGLKIGDDSIEGLRYGKIVLLTDQDTDGAHIKSLLVSFFYKFWPSLYDKGVICDIDTPLYIASNGKEKIYIYDKEQYTKLLNEGKLKDFTVKYFKGLAGLKKDDWDYFLNRSPKYIPLSRTNKTDEMLDIVFGPSSEKRKVWLGQ